MPAWLEVIDLTKYTRDDSLSFEEKRDGIAQILSESEWAQCYADDSLLRRALRYAGQSEAPEIFEHWMNYVYDYADHDRVWLETIRGSHPAD